MSLSSECVVTNILANSEILTGNVGVCSIKEAYYASSPVEYDLSSFIKKRKEHKEVSRFGNRYIFVK